MDQPLERFTCQTDYNFNHQIQSLGEIVRAFSVLTFSVFDHQYVALTAQVLDDACHSSRGFLITRIHCCYSPAKTFHHNLVSDDTNAQYTREKKPKKT